MSYNTIRINFSVFDIWGKVICLSFLLISLSAPVALMVVLLCKTHTVALSCRAVIGIPVMHMLSGGNTQASLAQLTGCVYVESAKTLATCRLWFCGQQNIHCSAMITLTKVMKYGYVH